MIDLVKLLSSCMNLLMINIHIIYTYKLSVRLSPMKYPLVDHYRQEEMNHKDRGETHSVFLLMKVAVHCSVVGSGGDCCTILYF